MAIYIDDRDLVAAHRAGDSEAFDELVREHRRSLLAHAHKKLRCDAASEDALQETLVRAYKALPRFNGEYRLGPWLHRIMHNVCIDEANRRRRDGEKVDLYVAQGSWSAETQGVEEELGFEFDDSSLRAALESLSEPYRQALELKFLREYDYSELAEASGVSEQNARARVSRAKAVMRSALKGVASLPLLLVGILKRGEKAAAAASGTFAAGAVSATNGSVVAAQATTVASSMPVLAETGVVIAKSSPVLVPAVAKAAMGVGLAAAALSPGGDGAVQLAMNNLTSASHNLIVESESTPSGLSSTGAIQVAVGETLSPEAPELASVSSLNENSNMAPPIAAAIESVMVSGSISSNSLVVIPGGAGRYDLAGPVAVSLGQRKIQGTLDSASWLNIETEPDIDGRRRIDALLIIDLPDFAQADIRLAGFGLGTRRSMEFEGIFRSSNEDWQFYGQGSVSGQIATDDSSGDLSLYLTP